jgi:hypothetical protein
MSQNRAAVHIEARQPAANAASDQQPRGRPFAKGVSGNPAGKSPGTKNSATRILEALLEAARNQT